MLLSGREGTPIVGYTGGSALKGYLFQAVGKLKSRDFTSWSIQEGRENCYLSIKKGLSCPPNSRFI